MSSTKNCMADNKCADESRWVAGPAEEVDQFTGRLLLESSIYYVLACECGCCRIDCPQSAKVGGVVNVVKIVNNNLNWRHTWLNLH